MNQPSYLNLLESGELAMRVAALELLLERCTVCPKECLNNRLNNEIAACYSGRLPILHATLEPQNAAEFAGGKVLAFAGIGRPAKFYATLAGLGAEIVARHDFPDHHRYSEAEIGGLVAAAQALGARPVTTAKDWVRVPERWRGEIGVLAVAIAWREPERLSDLLSRFLPAPATHA